MRNDYFPLDGSKLHPFPMNEAPLDEATLWDLLDGEEDSGSGSFSSSSPCNDEIGSLAYHCKDAVDSRIAGYTAEEAEAALPLFSTMDHEEPEYVRNTDCWLNDIVDQTTCASVWNNSYDNPSCGGRGGVLISPRHIALAAHTVYPQNPNGINVGTVFRFVDVDNNVVERTVDAIQYVASDITIALLNDDVPSSIGFAKVMPSNWEEYLPISSSCKVPAVATEKHKYAAVSDVHSVTSGSTWISCSTPTDPQRLLFFEFLEGGDSGHPAFFIINDELVLLATWQSGGAGHGPCHAGFISEINTAMTSLGGGYNLTTAYLSGFTSY